MKLARESDMRIYVEHEAEESGVENAELFQRVFTVWIDSAVHIRFVPDVSMTAPPWGYRGAAEDFSVVTPTDARIWTILTSPYSVTPNSDHAGRVERVTMLEPLTDAHGRVTVEDSSIWYVHDNEWSELEEELRDLSQITWYSEFVRLSEIKTSTLGRFLSGRFLTSYDINHGDAGKFGFFR